MRLTIAGSLAAAAALGVVLVAAGPALMQIAFGDKFEYDRLGLLLVAVGLGLYLSGTTLGQAALACNAARPAAVAWLTSAACFLLINIPSGFDRFRQVEVAFAALRAAALRAARPRLRAPPQPPRRPRPGLGRRARGPPRGRRGGWLALSCAADAMIISRTPLRISIGGGGSDLPSYYERFGGFFISAAIDKHVYIGINKIFTRRIFDPLFSQERVTDPDEIEHRIIREAIKLHSSARSRSSASRIFRPAPGLARPAASRSRCCARSTPTSASR